MELDIVGTKDVAGKRSAMKKAYIIKGKLYSEGELRKFAVSVVEERIKFCKETRKENDVDNCVCEAVKRWVKLFRDYPMEGSKDLGNLRVAAVKEVFDEMKKSGIIKCW